MAASLDHALWFHRPFRADDWLLYAQDSPNLRGARGFSRGLIFARDGTLVASVAQEGLLRERRTDRTSRRMSARIAALPAYDSIAVLICPQVSRRSPVAKGDSPLNF